MKSLPQGEGGASETLLEAFSRDLGPAAEAVRELLGDPTPEKAAELAGRLPELLPSDPAMAAVLAEEMAKEFGKAKAEGEARTPSAPQKEEISQADAEQLYEEMMSK